MNLNKLCNLLKIDFTIKEIKYSEVLCLKLLKYKIIAYSSHSMLTFLLGNGIFFDEEIKLSEQTLNELYQHAFTILKIFLEDIRYLDFSPLEIALCIIKTLREKQKLEKSPVFFEIYCNVDLNMVNNCIIVLKSILNYTPPTKFRKSYSHENKEININKKFSLISSNKIYPNTYISFSNYFHNCQDQQLSKEFYQNNKNLKFKETNNFNYINDSCETNETRSCNSLCNSEERHNYPYYFNSFSPKEQIFYNNLLMNNSNKSVNKKFYQIIPLASIFVNKH